MEMEVLENLQELKELNQRQATVDFEGMIDQYRMMEERERQRQKEEDERETKLVMQLNVLYTVYCIYFNMSIISPGGYRVSHFPSTLNLLADLPFLTNVCLLRQCH